MSLIESMLLWLPASMLTEQPLIEDCTAANGAILDFLDGELSFSDTLETIEFYGADVDEYRRELSHTFGRYGV